MAAQSPLTVAGSQDLPSRQSIPHSKEVRLTDDVASMGPTRVASIRRYGLKDVD